MVFIFLLDDVFVSGTLCAPLYCINVGSTTYTDLNLKYLFGHCMLLYIHNGGRLASIGVAFLQKGGGDGLLYANI